MALSVESQPMSAPLQKLDGVRPKPAKVEAVSPAVSITLSGVIKDALKAHYGKLEVAARAMGDMDPSQLSRDLQTGAFNTKRLDMLDAAGKAAVTKALNETFGFVADPKSEARRVLREAHRKLDEVADLLEIA